MNLIRASKRIEVPILLPSIAPYDAISTHVIELRDGLRSHGIEAVIYADEIKPQIASEARGYRRLIARPYSERRYFLYQLATGSNIYRFIRSRKEPLLAQFHNITPRREFVMWEPGISTSMALGRRQLELLSQRVDLALAISPYNARDLIEADYRKIVLSPPLIRHLPSDGVGSEHREVAVAPTLLFVGRLAPNKAQEDLIRALRAYNDNFSPRAKLMIVGSETVAGYVKYLKELAVVLELDGDVDFISNVDDAELLRLYRTSDLFVSASHHEGFGFPFIEAMRNDLPSVAVSTSAIPETIEDGGITLTDNDPVIMATAWNVLLHDKSLRRAVIENGRKVAEKVSLSENLGANLRALANAFPIEGFSAEPLFFDKDLVKART
ncbi:MAG: glycosyltransferase family 4 protein [Actinomycetota bacterium]|nr:glycosyltransferase family 4 protein [Actinomycetota bacterium]